MLPSPEEVIASSVSVLVQQPEKSLPNPPLKWAGGKRWLVPRLRHMWSGHEQRRLVEPFVGGMAVALGLGPTNALLNDVNPHLINFYQWIQAGLDMRNNFDNSADYYYAARERFNALIDAGKHESREAARLFYYLNRTGFNGLCRFNSKGLFNVPFGRYKTINYARDFRELEGVIGNWVLASTDFETLKLSGNDLIYADPPYDVEFTSYSQNGFNWQDQVRLAKWLAAQHAPVIASNQATDRMLELYSSLGFNIETLPAPRRISSTGDRTPALEMLATIRL